jgi:hypothetical protein
MAARREGVRKDVVIRAVAITLLVAMAAVPVLSQTAQLNQVMRRKLQHSQRILEAVVTSNWQLMEGETRALAATTSEQAWAVLQTPEYVRHSAAFLRATDSLTEAARLRDLEGASLGFVALSSSCVSCHRYLTRARIVSSPK